SGVLLGKTKNNDNAPFIWTVDANPQDIDKVDFVLPNGTPVKMTIGDYRQLADSLFPPGTPRAPSRPPPPRSPRPPAPARSGAASPPTRASRSSRAAAGPGACCRCATP